MRCGVVFLEGVGGEQEVGIAGHSPTQGLAADRLGDEGTRIKPWLHHADIIGVSCG